MTAAKLKIKKGDQVVVISGASKGAKGEVLEVLRAENRVRVQGVNMRTVHKKPTQTTPGGIEKIEGAIHISNVALADPKTGKATRVGYKVLKDGTKVRVAKASGETIEGK
ncbi:MAG: 50S ribosomal protein L24 [Rhodospirillales bacterium]|nr:50S ribosomal protein L24 [Alphaproteobacteria bacterium]MCB9986477.1 50S ribosomal protein L24 [Rhodospirillales bacterium]USO06978.1 MAG: 50S ribosomal protein L24 [Rhodospirillales bacterium]